MAKAAAAKSAKKSSDGFSAEEKAAMKERAKELKAQERAKNDREAGEKDVMAKIAEMEGLDRSMATKIHEIVKANAPHLMPRTWYGMPAYTNQDGKIICFFKDAKKFSTRYATLGFEEFAQLDDGDMWPTSYALTNWTDKVEAKIVALVKQAAS
ncbi:MAG: hypothetical protein GC179_29920 [Anaerolineaceae bacterium]|nr:hypothetical protein [Anaerolineaceae bacterium]